MEILILIALIFAYILPWLIAKYRNHKSSASIFWTVVFFGWTGIGWLLCFIWSWSGNVKETIVNQARV